jgi:hypothetical protein
VRFGKQKNLFSRPEIESEFFGCSARCLVCLTTPFQLNKLYRNLMEKEGCNLEVGMVVANVLNKSHARATAAGLPTLRSDKPPS